MVSRSAGKDLAKERPRDFFGPARVGEVVTRTQRGVFDSPWMRAGEKRARRCKTFPGLFMRHKPRSWRTGLLDKR